MDEEWETFCGKFNFVMVVGIDLVEILEAHKYVKRQEQFYANRYVYAKVE